MSRGKAGNWNARRSGEAFQRFESERGREKRTAGLFTEDLPTSELRQKLTPRVCHSRSALPLMYKDTGLRRGTYQAAAAAALGKSLNSERKWLRVLMDACMAAWRISDIRCPPPSHLVPACCRSDEHKLIPELRYRRRWAD